jgi:serine protease Do/serine protease DegQ
MKQVKRSIWFAVALVGALSVVNVGLTLANSSMPSHAKSVLPVFQDGTPVPSLVPMIRMVMPTVVNVSTRGEIPIHSQIYAPFLNNPFFRQFFGMNPLQQQGPSHERFQALGSGVIINARKGYILTNDHVIRHATKIVVTTYNHRHYPARVVGKDQETDLAVLQIHAPGLHQIAFGNSAKLAVGDFVVAIGNPFGLGHTATFGIVSGLGRTDVEQNHIGTFIQTDAAINPGNSGGALVNLRGQLVGINTAILTTGSNGGNIGIGFAIPVNLAQAVVHQIIRYGRVERGVLGVLVQDVTPRLRRAFGLAPGQRGALIAQVEPDSGAARAGLRAGDIITSINGQPVHDVSTLRGTIAVMRVGTHVRVGFLRNGHAMTTTAVIGPNQHHKRKRNFRFANKNIGAQLSNLNPSSPLYGKVKGVMVIAVAPRSPAAKAGLEPGDVIVAIDQHPIDNLAEFKQALESYHGILLLTVQRGSGTFFTTLR